MNRFIVWKPPSELIFLLQVTLKRLFTTFAVIELWIRLPSDSSDKLIGLTKIQTAAIASLFAYMDARTGSVSLKNEEIIRSLCNFSVSYIVHLLSVDDHVAHLRNNIFVESVLHKRSD